MNNRTNMAGVLSETQIASIVHKDPVLRASHFVGTVYRDRLPAIQAPLPDDTWMIVDLQPSNSTGVGHFCLLGVIGDSGVYCDPVGGPPPDSCVAWLGTQAKGRGGASARGKQVSINHVQMEPLGSDYCGWYCLLIARALLRGGTLAGVVTRDFWACRPDTPFPGEQNDRIVKAQIKLLKWNVRAQR